MGRSRSQRRNSRFFGSDDDTLSSSSTGGLSDLTLGQEGEDEQVKEDTTLDNHLEELDQKRGSTRENGLKGLINAFKSNVQHEFVKDKNVTLLYQFISSMKRGSASETALAAHALGLLAITVGSGDIAHQVVEDSIPHLFRASKLGSDTVNRILVIESLAIVTFVGGNDVETERSMDLLWQLVQHKGNSHADQATGTSKPQPAVRAAAISAWTFLLTTVPTQRIDSHYKKQSLPILSSLLDKDDREVRIAAGEAIALIFEASSWREEHNRDNCDHIDSDYFNQESDHSVVKTTSVDVLQRRILEQMKTLSIEAGGKGSSKKELNSQRSSFRDFLASVEDGVGPEMSVKLQHGDVFKVSTWIEAIQINLLRRYLGGGFQKHMQENPLLHEIFEFIPKQERQQVLSGKQKRMFMSPNSVVSKARTQELNNQRRIAHAGNHGHYGVGLDED